MNPLEVSPTNYHTTLTCDRSNVLSSDSWLSKSALWELSKRSLYSWRFAPSVFKPTPSMRWGSLVDCLTTTPDEVDDLYVIQPATYPAKESTKKDAPMVEKPWNKNAKFCKGWAADHEGKEVIPAELMEEALKAHKMLTETHELSAKIFANSQTQVIVGAKIQGCQVKGLLDLAPINEDFLVDLKTTNDFSMDGFAKTIGKFGYHVQGGLYLLLWNAMFPNDQRDSFRIIWQSSEAPYEVCVTEICGTDLEAGEEYARHLINRLVEATEADYWPMLGEGLVTTLTRPTWAGSREESQIETDDRQVIEAGGES